MQDITNESGTNSQEPGSRDDTDSGVRLEPAVRHACVKRCHIFSLCSTAKGGGGGGGRKGSEHLQQRPTLHGHKILIS